MDAIPPALVASLAECKAFLRLERDDEDALIAGFIRTATALCEAFTGQWLLLRDGEQRLGGGRDWQRLIVRPVVAITGVADAAGPLPAGSWECDIAADGSGWVRLLAGAADRPSVAFRAGLGADWNAIPEPLRQGVIRLVAHLFSQRDAADAGPPPAAVAALWRPWRRIGLL